MAVRRENIFIHIKPTLYLHVGLCAVPLFPRPEESIIELVEQL